MGDYGCGRNQSPGIQGRRAGETGITVKEVLVDDRRNFDLLNIY